MSFNADLIRARCAEIQESVARLEEFQALSLEASSKIGMPWTSHPSGCWSQLRRRWRSAITCLQKVCTKFQRSMRVFWIALRGWFHF